MQIRDVSAEDASLDDPSIGVLLGTCYVPVPLWPIPSARNAEEMTVFPLALPESSGDEPSKYTGGSIQLGLGFVCVTGLSARRGSPVLPPAGHVNAQVLVLACEFVEEQLEFMKNTFIIQVLDGVGVSGDDVTNAVAAELWTCLHRDVMEFIRSTPV